MTLKRNLIASGILMASAFAAAQAYAWSEDGDVKSISFSAADTISKVHVISTDGKTWNAFKSGDVQFYATMNVQMRYRSKIRNMGVVLGDCPKHSCLAMPPLWFAGVNAEDWATSANIVFNAKKIPLTNAGGIAVLPEGNEMVARCNDHLQANGPTKSYSFEKTLAATLVVDTFKRDVVDDLETAGTGLGFPSEVNEFKSDTFKVHVVCDPVIKAPTDDIAVAQPDFKPTGIKLFLATVNGANTDGPNPATKCPALRVTTRVQTSKAGGVDMRLWRKQGNGQTTSELKSAYASFDAAKNGYFADFVRVEKFDATTYLQFMAESVGGTFAPSTSWKDITVHCTGAGGGGLTNGQPDNGVDKPQASWTGDVNMADSAGTRKHCPRKGQVFFEVKRNEPGSFKYKISCSNGQGFGGTSQSFNKGNGIFEAFGAHDINVNRTRKIQCTLQEVKASGARVTIDKGSFDYTCNNPAIDPSADDITAPPKPTQAEDKPDVSIFCKPGFKLVGKKCVKKPVISILCRQGFTLVGKNCVKKPVVSILCARGFKLEGRKCVRKPVIAVKRLPKKLTVQSPN